MQHALTLADFPALFLLLTITASRVLWVHSMVLAFLAFSQHYEVFLREGMLTWIIYSQARHTFFQVTLWTYIVNIWEKSHVLTIEASLSINVLQAVMGSMGGLKCNNLKWLVNVSDTIVMIAVGVSFRLRNTNR